MFWLFVLGLGGCCLTDSGLVCGCLCGLNFGLRVCVGWWFCCLEVGWRVGGLVFGVGFWVGGLWWVGLLWLVLRVLWF